MTVGLGQTPDKWSLFARIQRQVRPTWTCQTTFGLDRSTTSARPESVL
ncbi:MAG TPA: hypothetical protein VIL55_00305 [Naasia sp.]|jgi:hypothetical protein